MLLDRAWLDEQLAAGRTTADIADQLGCSTTTVNSWRRHHFGPKRPPIPELDDREWLQQRRAAGHTIAEIAEDLDCTITQVAKALRQCGLTQAHPPTPGALRDPEWLDAELARGRTIVEIASWLGCSDTTVSRWAQKHFGTRYRHRTRYPDLADPTWLAARQAAGHSQHQIAHEIGCTPRAVRDALDRHGLPRQRHAP